MGDERGPEGPLFHGGAEGVLLHGLQRCISDVTASFLWQRPFLQRGYSALLVPNANHFIHFRDKNLAIADFASASGLQDRIHRGIDHRVRQNYFKLKFRK